MKNNVMSLLLIFFLMVSCSKDEARIYNVPECLLTTVNTILTKPPQEPRAKIEKWKFEDQEVYLIDAQNFPDGQVFVITLDCQKTICTFGGIDGPDNDCKSWENAIFIETVWQDRR